MPRIAKMKKLPKQTKPALPPDGWERVELYIPADKKTISVLRPLTRKVS